MANGFMKGNLIYIIGWVAYEARISALPGSNYPSTFCGRITKITDWVCSQSVQCEHCPFIHYRKSYLESY